MNVTSYTISSYSNNQQLRPMQKQSQTNPNQRQFWPAVMGANPNQSQTNPTCGEPACTEQGRSVEPSNPISKARGLNEALGQVLTERVRFNILSGFRQKRIFTA
jgi:hypothetical protein